MFGVVFSILLLVGSLASFIKEIVICFVCKSFFLFIFLSENLIFSGHLRNDVFRVLIKRNVYRLMVETFLLLSSHVFR